MMKSKCFAALIAAVSLCLLSIQAEETREAAPVVPAITEDAVLQRRSEVEKAAQQIRDLRAELLRTNETVKALAAAAEEARQRYQDRILRSPEYQEVARNLEKAEEAIRNVQSNNLEPNRVEVGKARQELFRLRRARQNLEYGTVSDQDLAKELKELSASFIEANRALDAGINTDPAMDKLLTVHALAHQAYQNALDILKEQESLLEGVEPDAEKSAPAVP